jgi:hypothetical protein
MADGTIPIRWSEPLPVGEAAVEAAEPVAGPVVEPVVQAVRPEVLQGQHPQAVALAAVLVLEGAVEVVEAEAGAELLPHLLRRRIFSAPSRICFMSPI